MCRMYPSSSYYHLNSKCKILSHNSKIDPESAILYDSPINNNDNNNIYGLFNDKYPLHIIPHPKKENVFMNRISYDVMSDAYYENGIFNKKYIEFWDQGALYYENLIHATHYSDDRTYLRDTTALILENSKLSASIIYKFDYSSYETLSITRLNLKLNCYDNNTGYHLIISISTDHNSDNKSSSSLSNNLKWNIIKETYIKNTNERTNLPKNLTHFIIKNNKIFYIKAEIIKKHHKNYQRNLQLFPYIKNHFDEFSIKKNFGLDVIVELSSLSSLSSLSYNFDNLKYKNYMIKSESCDGLFNDKYKFNVLPIEKMKNIYNHRISYNVITNAYYENGKTDIKYLKRWDRGTFTNKNIYYSLENSTNIEKYLGVDKKNQSAHITWKFDYRPGNFYINSLKLLLKFHYSSNRSKIQWLIKLLPTRKNPISEFKPINFPLQENNILDLTEIVKDEYGFILKVKMIGGKNHLFRQDVNKNEKSLLNDNFDMDVEVKLRPNIICDEFFKKNFIYSMNEKNFLLNDKNTSDFIIKLKEELSTTNNYKNILEKNFYLHSKILISKSDYFKALFNSQMIESKNRFLNLNDLSLNIFEKLLLYIYYDNIDNLNDINDWIDLLYISSRFLIPKLVQICEFSIRNYVNIDNLEEINLIAKECNAIQLVKYCEMYEINV
ncbi:uncharacterized protein OCT59_005026 [Rhizophagus irregularis]|uniref:Uncharacterized protein n=3 Tax=Rhizophagus irregularis TaxID=588596 RepID=A0A2H5RTT6_RHIID|nr:hypothetical protein GLOIN_2v1766029 [Rhizophagus irregularis DAOM 181602=DAOM 197198]POG78989.1 hypothetical protein GLOIN_2v1766029 [Rhizophagus irregularis DAOM 181602=DAOM 197198]UZO13528.1 hypothetical protein OCT59_005026 [Rhizophagus irregularis]|eukprot:XP_025185855.1 hypothetical protein GLOIN_2v1766029 [Rhizophagus irregularis DAOM 181602=DAOM 197198]